jgi:hypothetical protein
MQAIVDRVMRAFTPEHPTSNDEALGGHQEATEFAAELLDNYKAQLIRRASGNHRR